MPGMSVGAMSIIELKMGPAPLPFIHESQLRYEAGLSCHKPNHDAHNPKCSLHGPWWFERWRGVFEAEGLEYFSTKWSLTR